MIILNRGSQWQAPIGPVDANASGSVIDPLLADTDERNADPLQKGIILGVGIYSHAFFEHNQKR